MKPRYHILIFSFLLLSLFSCKRSGTPLVEYTAEKVKLTNTKATLQGEQGNVRVVLSNPNYQPVFAVVQIIFGGQPGSTPIDEKVINLNAAEIEPITEVVFSILPGTYYQVRVIDTYGQDYYMPSVTATEYPVTTSFHGLINGPGTVKYQPDPNYPLPNPNDDSTLFPPLPGVTFPFTVRIAPFHSYIDPVAAVQLLGEGGNTLQTRLMSTPAPDSVGGGYTYKLEAQFNVVPGTVFRVACRLETGAIIYSALRTAINAPQEQTF